MQNWEKMSEEPYRAGYRKMLRRKYKLPDGRIDEYDIKDEGDAVCILGLTPDDEVIIAKQFRPGPEKVLLELPGGVRDKNESPDEAIKREFLEETGYSGDLHLVNTCWNCGYSNRATHNFVATNCKKVQEPQLDENEFIEVALLPLNEFKELLQSGELTDSKTAFYGLEYLRSVGKI